jgi:nitroreductase
MDLQEAVLTRRSIRRFTEDTVTDQELQQIFAADF